jgi:hypothetical protein
MTILANFAARINEIMTTEPSYPTWALRQQAIDDALNRARKLVWESLDELTE